MQKELFATAAICPAHRVPCLFVSNKSYLKKNKIKNQNKKPEFGEEKLSFRKTSSKRQTIHLQVCTVIVEVN